MLRNEGSKNGLKGNKSEPLPKQGQGAREQPEMAGSAWAKEALQEIARGFEQLAAKEEGDQYAYRKRLQPDRSASNPGSDAFSMMILLGSGCVEEPGFEKVELGPSVHLALHR